ncbi:MAG: hypothetical protein LBQ63_08100 [Deltaproteobacteria bacterium]|jgi:hypothetical protein|nr:hypothetical protein [Deltaproteobacteria bacterium]
MANSADAAAIGVAAATARSEIGGQVVIQTLDKLNQYGGSGRKYGNQAGISSTYHFARQVLSSVYSGKGAVASLKG